MNKNNWALHSHNGFNPNSVEDLKALHQATEKDLIAALDMLEEEKEQWEAFCDSSSGHISQVVRGIAFGRITQIDKILTQFKPTA